MDTSNTIYTCIDVHTCFSRNIKSEDLNINKTEVTNIKCTKVAVFINL